jgi:hypothetical protein
MLADNNRMDDTEYFKYGLTELVRKVVDDQATLLDDECFMSYAACLVDIHVLRCNSRFRFQSNSLSVTEHSGVADATSLLESLR